MNIFVPKPAGMPDYHGSEAAALRTVRREIEAAFAGFGYSPVEPAYLEAAGVFLDRSGEELRRRMYVFSDPGGRELCLRPELTIPVSRLYLQELAANEHENRLSYVGPVFRYESPEEGRYRQFHQAGIEFIGATHRAAADAEALALALAATRRAGLHGTRLVLNDLGLIHAFIDGLAIGDRWKARLHRAAWKLAAMRTIFTRAANGRTAAADSNGNGNGNGGVPLLNLLADLGAERSRLVVEEMLDLADVRYVGTRTADEIAARLISLAEEANAEPMSAEIIALIEGLLEIHGDPDQAFAAVERHARTAGIDGLGPGLDLCAERMRLLAAYGEQAEIVFDLGFRRNLEYYTSLIFEVHVPALGNISQICGGGRYDELLPLLGARRATPAVGFAIGLERLVVALRHQHGGRLPHPAPRSDALVVAAGNVDHASCVRVGAALRAAGWTVTLDTSNRRARNALGFAVKNEIPYMVFVGEDEIRAGKVRVKNLPTRHEEVVPMTELGAFVRRAARAAEVS